MFKGKIIENLAAVGYDSNNMHLAAYDWRLSYPNLEKRDGYFSKLKFNFEYEFRIIPLFFAHVLFICFNSVKF